MYDFSRTVFGRKLIGTDPVLDFQAMFWSVLIVVRLLMNWGMIWYQELYNLISFWLETELAGILAGRRILENFQIPMMFLNYFLIFPFYFYLILSVWSRNVRNAKCFWLLPIYSFTPVVILLIIFSLFKLILFIYFIIILFNFVNWFKIRI